MNGTSMKSWQTTLGGALTVFGKALVGVGVLPQLAGAPSKLLLFIALTGFIIEAIGGFFASLFAADAQALKQLSQRVDLNTTAVLTGDTSHLTKPHEPKEKG
jgi:hypothetical protein